MSENELKPEQKSCSNCAHHGLFVVLHMFKSPELDSVPALRTVRVECRRYAPRMENASLVTFPVQTLDDVCGEWTDAE